MRLALPKLVLGRAAIGVDGTQILSSHREHVPSYDRCFAVRRLRLGGLLTSCIVALAVGNDGCVRANDQNVIDVVTQSKVRDVRCEGNVVNWTHA